MVEVVSQRTALRKSGASYTGRCPFHDERTPSFSVNAVDKLYYCFGCGAKGDVITFVRETESLDFVGAIEWLADRFRVQLEYEETSPRPSAPAASRSPPTRRSSRPRSSSSGTSGTATPARRCASTSRAAVSARRSRRSSASGSHPGRAWWRRPAPGLHRRRAAGGRAGQPARQRLLPVPPDVPARGRARPRDRLPGAPAT